MGALIRRGVRCALVAVAAAGAIGCPAPAQLRADLLIRGGAVIDGSGGPAVAADVAVRDGRVVAIGRLDRVTAARTIDADGLIVAPGFVDLHSHADLVLLAPAAERETLLRARISQGVTTVVVGNCGLGVAPSNPAAAEILGGVNGWMTPDGVRAGALSVGEYLTRLERDGVPVNVAALVPHGPLRIAAMGLAPGAPSPAQSAAMTAALERGLDDGAFGLSFGLIYPPGMYSDTDELVDLAATVAARDGLVTLHVRGSSALLLDATAELIEVARRSGARVHHSHLEAVGDAYWPDVAGVLAAEDRARSAGLRISHDVFPYTRAATMMSAIFPPWALAGGVPALVERLGDPAARARIAADIEGHASAWPPWVEGGWPHNLVRAVGWDGIIVASVGDDDPADLVGLSLADIAERRGVTPFDAVADLMIEQHGRVGQLVAEISGTPDGLDPLLDIVAHPAGAIVSDAEDYGRGVPHPAHAGAFPRALRLGRERGILPVERLVERMTARPAEIAGLPDRGRLRAGAPADIVVFDPATVADRATWDDPRRLAAGIHWVIVNGHAVVEDGRFVGGLHGAVLRSGDGRERAVER